MRINYKLILIVLVSYSTCVNIFAHPNIKPKNNEVISNKHLQTQDDYLKIKTSITGNKNEMKDDISKNIVDQLYNRFEETTEYNNITSISKQPIDAVKREIRNLNDNNLKKSSINGLSNALLEFIATGSLSYGDITPDTALEELLTRKIKLSDDNIQQSRQRDIEEIEARETIQNIQKFYDNIKGMEKNNIDADIMDNIAEINIIGEELEKSTDNKVKNALIDIFLNKDNNTTVKLQYKLTKAEITELKKILKDREILPKEHGVIISKLQQFGTRIKNLFRKSEKNQEKISNETKYLDSDKDNSKNSEKESNITVSNKLSKEEVSDIIIENSNLFE